MVPNFKFDLLNISVRFKTSVSQCRIEQKQFHIKPTRFGYFSLSLLSSNMMSESICSVYSFQFTNAAVTVLSCGLNDGLDSDRAVQETPSRSNVSKSMTFYFLMDNSRNGWLSLLNEIEIDCVF